MSQWTHIAGVIRLDSMCYEHSSNTQWIERNRKEVLLEEILGPMLIWRGDEKEWDRISSICKLPKGSEGSIEYNIITNSDTESVDAFTIVIWGDLRDFGMEELSSLQKWFYDTCTLLNDHEDFNGIRMGSLHVVVEGMLGCITLTC